MMQGDWGVPGANAARLLPVRVSETTANSAVAAVDNTSLPTALGATEPARVGTIHLERHKARVRIEGQVDPAVLRLVLV
jgi:hypothetical protein